MKSFLQKTGFVIFMVIILFVGFNAIYYKTANHSRVTAFEVYDAIDRSSKQTEYTALILGDSVARQIFNPDVQKESEEICYLATNQAIMPAGNYILLDNFLQNNPQLETVYYVARPESLQGSINFIYTYSYFVTPLYTETFTKYLGPETADEIVKIFGSVPSKSEFVKWMLGKYPKLLESYNDGSEKIWAFRNRIHAQEMPDMSIDYIAKMWRTCMDRDIEFIILSPPLPSDYDQERIDRMNEKMVADGMGDLMNQYVGSIFYIEPEEFVDGIHMNKQFLGFHREEFVRRLIGTDS